MDAVTTRMDGATVHFWPCSKKPVVPSRPSQKEDASLWSMWESRLSSSGVHYERRRGGDIGKVSQDPLRPSLA